MYKKGKPLVGKRAKALLTEAEDNSHPLVVDKGGYCYHLPKTLYYLLSCPILPF